MRDFYDIYILTVTQPLDTSTFHAALKKTAEKRHTAVQMSGLESIIRTIAANGVMIELWSRYQKKYSYAADVTWEMAMAALKGLAMGINTGNQ